MSKEFTISKEYENIKAKTYLKKIIDVPHGALFKFIRNKRITLNGKKIKKDDTLVQGDIIKLWLDSIPIKDTKKNFTEAKNLGMEVIYDNPEFFALNKLPGVVVQGAQDNSESLSLHLAYLKNKWGDTQDFEYFHVHRLDKQTSGVLIIAKTRDSLRDLNALFRQRGVIKTYYCLCDGEFEEKQKTIELYLQRAPDENYEKVHISSTPHEKTKKTITHYSVEKTYTYGEDSFSLVKVQIETGFMHQIRVHMNHIGHPIIGDIMYGNSYINRKYQNSIPRQFLHAYSVEFTYNDKKHFIKAPLTKDLQDFLKYLKDS